MHSSTIRMGFGHRASSCCRKEWTREDVANVPFKICPELKEVQEETEKQVVGHIIE